MFNSTSSHLLKIKTFFKTLSYRKKIIFFVFFSFLFLFFLDINSIRLFFKKENENLNKLYYVEKVATLQYQLGAYWFSQKKLILNNSQDLKVFEKTLKEITEMTPLLADIEESSRKFFQGKEDKRDARIFNDALSTVLKKVNRKIETSEVKLSEEDLADLFLILQQISSLFNFLELILQEEAGKSFAQQKIFELAIKMLPTFQMEPLNIAMNIPFSKNSSSANKDQLNILEERINSFQTFTKHLEKAFMIAGFFDEKLKNAPDDQSIYLNEEKKIPPPLLDQALNILSKNKEIITRFSAPLDLTSETKKEIIELLRMEFDEIFALNKKSLSVVITLSKEQSNKHLKQLLWQSLTWMFSYLAILSILYLIIRPLKKDWKKIEAFMFALANGNIYIQLDDLHGELQPLGVSSCRIASYILDLVTSLRLASNQLTRSAQLIFTSLQSQNELTQNQAQDSKKITEASKKITETARDLSQTMTNVHGLVENASKTSIKGRQSLTEMSLSMKRTLESSKEMATMFALLNEKAKNITQIITTLTKIVDQTNLLSLNASLEAETAKKFNVNFVTIAEEIRRLADRSAFAALDIEKMIIDIISTSTAGAKIMANFSVDIEKSATITDLVNGQLLSVIDFVQNQSLIITDVNQKIQEQHQSADTIFQKMLDLDNTLVKGGDLVQDFSQTAEQFNYATKDLEQMVNSLTQKD